MTLARHCVAHCPLFSTALTEPARVGELLRAIDAFKGTYPVRAALALALLVFVRPGELRAVRWAAINLDKAEWKYTASKTKTEHLVSLSRQAVAILKDLWPLTGQGEYICSLAVTQGRQSAIRR